MSASDDDTPPPPKREEKLGSSGPGGSAAPVSAAQPAASPGVRRSRTGMAWLSACTAAVIAVALIIFMLQNTIPVQVTFLWMTATTSLALMLLIAAVGGIVLTLILGSARIIQLRHAVRKRNGSGQVSTPAQTRGSEHNDREVT
jgi:uncharacterized integral membrane protein